MKIVVVGAGSVGRSIARELINNGHDVLIIDRDADQARVSQLPAAEWVIADACEISTLEQVHLADYDHVVSSSGDDKVNLVVSFLARTEFAVPRTVARVNNPRNEWLFNESWGVDVAVSTPRLMTALVEEAVVVGDVVSLFEFQQGNIQMVELTLPPTSPFVGTRVGDIPLPADTLMTAVLRDGRPIAPSPDEAVEAGDELLFLCPPEAQHQLATTLNPDSRPREVREDDD